MGRAMGLDLGQRRIGVAVSDDRRALATPLATVTRADVGSSEERLAQDHRALRGYLSDVDAVVVVIGMPYSMSGRIGPAAAGVAEEVRLFEHYLGLSGLDVPVVTHDERLTTVTAGHRLRASGRKSGSRRARQDRSVIDQLAAAVMLQSWLDMCAKSRDHSAVENPAVENPAVENPAVENPAVENPAVENPAVENPAVENPAPRGWSDPRGDR
jgi:putative Holliday junction resolvase